MGPRSVWGQRGGGKGGGPQTRQLRLIWSPGLIKSQYMSVTRAAQKGSKHVTSSSPQPILCDTDLT